jgi:membrane-associated phospholipid phosphatase
MFALVLFFVWKRWWPSLVTLTIAGPGGIRLNEWLKLVVHRQRPFVEGAFVDWSGYSFDSGHTIGATLLYGQLLLFVRALTQGAPFALALHCQCCIAGSPGGIHRHRVRRAFSH